MNSIVLRHAETGGDIAACFPVFVQLRPHLADADELVTRVRRQQGVGYRVLAAWRDGVPIGIAGYRTGNPEGLRQALEQSLAGNEPALIEVPVGDMPSPWQFIDLPKVRGA